MTKKQFNFRLEPELIKELEKWAKKDNRTLTNYIETVLLQHLQTKTNETKSRNKDR